MLGCLQQTHPDVDGVPADVSARANKDDKSVPFLPRATEEKQMELDPRHETEHVLRQLPGVAAVDVSRRPNRRVPKLRADIFQRLAITQKQTGKCRSRPNQSGLWTRKAAARTPL